MSDIEITIGYIGYDVVALCDDVDGSYAFYGEYLEDKGVFLTRMSSNDGLITTGRFKGLVGARQMIMTAMARHIDIREQERAREAESPRFEGDRDKVH